MDFELCAPQGGPQTNTTRSTATGNARPSAAAGLEGLGLAGMDQIFAGGADATMLNQLMQNPALSQMMQSLFSNPQYMNQAKTLTKQSQC